FSRDWSSDVCSSDLPLEAARQCVQERRIAPGHGKAPYRGAHTTHMRSGKVKYKYFGVLSFAEAKLGAARKFGAVTRRQRRAVERDRKSVVEGKSGDL